MYLIYLIIGLSIVGLLFALALFIYTYKQSEGNEKMIKIAKAIREGANAYLKRQYLTVSIFFVLIFILLLILSLCGILETFVPYTFISGGAFSALSGYIGMKTATMANSRTANAAQTGLTKGLRVAFSAGSVMGFVVVGLGLLSLSVWFLILYIANGGNQFNATTVMPKISADLLAFGMGASSMALFARVGGGIFTKAADVGADLVGKVETGIPEDDPRNPAVIADNVGDNVGDVAGMGADLFESYVGSIVSTCSLATVAASEMLMSHKNDLFSFKDNILTTSFNLAIFPMLLAAVGIICSIIGSFFVRTKENATQKSLLKSLRTGTFISAILIAIMAFLLVCWLLPGNYGVFFAIVVGLLAGILIGTTTEYFTSDSYSPTKKLAKTTQTGTATVAIGGISLGMLSTVAPVLIISVSVLASYFLTGGRDNMEAGLFGIGISAVGMLSTLGITLATDAYGPIADNAGGIAQMAGLDEKVRERTDALDSLGNTTAATGKGFAIGSAALTALTLIAAYVQQVKSADPSYFSIHDLNLTNPSVLIGLFIGGMCPFLFAALTMNAVGNAAQSIVSEVRRQFKEIVGIMDGKASPDYHSCVYLCTKSAQKLMIIPSIMAVVIPLVTGMILGANGVVGLLAGTTVTGFVLAIMMANSGGAWDNAKKYIENGHFGGKGSDAHKAAVVGDTIGDPFKDTAGPSINILIKLTSMVSIVFVALVLATSFV